METGSAKAALRREMAGRRDDVHGPVCPDHATRRLLAWIRALAAVEVVAGYLPIRSEIDPRPAMARLVGEGYRVCVPVVEARDRPLVFRLWTPGVRLVPGGFGVTVPETDARAVPEALIVPLLAFDTAGYRLGYGGGFYDRTLEALNEGRRVFATGFAYEAQRLDTLPREAHDRRLDAVVTERATYVC